MKVSSTHSLRNQLVAAGSALAASMSLVPAAATAQIYVPEDQLTPYQIVASDGNCIEAEEVTEEPTFIVRLKPCDANNMQKFYLLDKPAQTHDAPTDFVPQTDGATFVTSITPANARIALAAEVSNRSGSGLANLRRAYLRHVGDGGHAWIDRKEWNLAQADWRINMPQRWDWRADENQSFTVPGDSGTVQRIRFGVHGSWLYMDASGGTSVVCSNDTFPGDDPAYGTAKKCYHWNGTAEDTALKVVLASGSQPFMNASRECLTSPHFGLGSCWSQEALWTLRPTTHPN